MRGKIYITFAKIDFECPYCNIKYEDKDDVYLKRINKNKDFTTGKQCECGKKFYITSNIKGELVTFK